MMLNEKIYIKKRVLLQLVLLLLVFVSSYIRAEPTITKWTSANPPNYETNVDLKCPYSNIPFQDERPDCSTFSSNHDNWEPCINAATAGNKILDFWGEGRITEETLITGFKDSYNVNHQFQLVSNGPDRLRKIPNRIPTKGYSDVCLAKYIADSSFTTITIMGAPIKRNTIYEMLRIIKKDNFSAIIAYGYERNDPSLELLTEELKKNNFIENSHYTFSAILLEPSLEPVVFTYNERKDEL
jgi:hypothetical protein